MNRTKIEYVDYTWVPVHGCPGNEISNCHEYCYGKEMADRFHRPYEPTFYPERLDEPLLERKPSRIFTCSVSDIFAPFFKPLWSTQIFKAMLEAHWHTYLLLTKWPENIGLSLRFPDNWWIGSSVTSLKDSYRISEVAKVPVKIRFISFEPLLGSIHDNLGELHKLNWIIIGARTGRMRCQPVLDWIYEITEEADKYDIPVFMKNNLKWNGERRQEFPK